MTFSWQGIASNFSLWAAKPIPRLQGPHVAVPCVPSALQCQWDECWNIRYHYMFYYAVCDNSSLSTSPFQPPFPRTELKQEGGRWTEVLLLPSPVLLIDLRLSFGWDLIRKQKQNQVSVLTRSRTLIIQRVSQRWTRFPSSVKWHWVHRCETPCFISKQPTMKWLNSP